VIVGSARSRSFARPACRRPLALMRDGANRVSRAPNMPSRAQPYPHRSQPRNRRQRSPTIAIPPLLPHFPGATSPARRPTSMDIARGLHQAQGRGSRDRPPRLRPLHRSRPTSGTPSWLCSGGAAGGSSSLMHRVPTHPEQKALGLAAPSIAQARYLPEPLRQPIEPSKSPATGDEASNLRSDQPRGCHRREAARPRYHCLHRSALRYRTCTTRHPSSVLGQTYAFTQLHLPNRTTATTVLLFTRHT
jgi:hypothetical protein